MIQIVNYLELSDKFTKITSEDSIIYKNKNHSIMISKKEPDKFYLLYKKQVLVIFTVDSKNEELIIYRLKSIFDKQLYTEVVDADVNNESFVKTLVNSNFIYDSTNYNIENLGILYLEYSTVVVSDYLLFMDINEKTVVYCIELNETNIRRKKEKKEMPTKFYEDLKKSTNERKQKTSDRLKYLFDKALNTRYIKEIDEILVSMGCETDGCRYFYRNKNIITIQDKKLILNISNSQTTFDIDDNTIDNLIKHLENVYL